MGLYNIHVLSFSLYLFYIMTASFIKFSFPTFMLTLFLKFAALVQHAAPSCGMPLYIVLRFFLSAFTRWIIIHETILWFWVNGILDFFVFFGYLDKCSRDMLWNELFHLGINELVRDVTVRAY